MFSFFLSFFTHWKQLLWQRLLYFVHYVSMLTTEAYRLFQIHCVAETGGCLLLHTNASSFSWRMFLWRKIVNEWIEQLGFLQSACLFQTLLCTYWWATWWPWILESRMTGLPGLKIYSWKTSFINYVLGKKQLIDCMYQGFIQGGGV